MTPAEETRLTIKSLGKGGQTKLARLLSVNPRTVRRWISGKFEPSPVMLEKIISLRD